MIKAIIWDMDGTFINSEDYWTAMPRVWLKKHGIELQESPWKFSSIYPQNQSLPTYCLCFHLNL